MAAHCKLSVQIRTWILLQKSELIPSLSIQRCRLSGFDCAHQILHEYFQKWTNSLGRFTQHRVFVRVN